MYVTIKIRVCNVGTILPFGFYYKGSGRNMKVVVVGDTLTGSYKKVSYPFSDCEIFCSKMNNYGDISEI